jgi:hypothetical protein
MYVEIVNAGTNCNTSIANDKPNVRLHKSKSGIIDVQRIKRFSSSKDICIKPG